MSQSAGAIPVESATAPRDVKIGPTAHYTAYTWFRLGLPHSELFATCTGALLFWLLHVESALPLAVQSRLSPRARIPSLPDYLEVRHRTIEHALEKLAPDRIVELGAGLSRRGVTWAADRGSSYLEVDLPHMVEAKRIKLAAAPAALQARFRPHLSQVAQDVLAPGFADWLAERLDGAERPVVIAEGVLGYFPLDERKRLASYIAEALTRAGGGYFLCDIRAQEGDRWVRAAGNIVRAAIAMITGGRTLGVDFASLAEAARFFESAGFDETRFFGPSEVPGLEHQRNLSLPGRIWQLGASPEA